MDAGMVEAVTRWVGVTITLVGAFIVSPAATIALVGRWQRSTVRAVRRAEDAIRSIVRRPRTLYLTGQIGLESGSLSGAGTLTATGTANLQVLDQSVEGRLGRLEARAATTDTRLAQVSTEAAADRAAFRGELSEVRQEQRAGTAELHARLEHAEAQAVEVDAAALPVVALGVFVSGLAPDAHRLPVVLWVLILAAAVALTLRAVQGARRRRAAH